MQYLQKTGKREPVNTVALESTRRGFILDLTNTALVGGAALFGLRTCLMALRRRNTVSERDKPRRS